MERPTHVLISFLLSDVVKFVSPPFKFPHSGFNELRWEQLEARFNVIGLGSNRFHGSWSLSGDIWRHTLMKSRTGCRSLIWQQPPVIVFLFIIGFHPSTHPLSDPLILTRLAGAGGWGGAVAPPLLMLVYDYGISRDVYSHFVDIHWKTTKDGNNGEPNYMWIFFLKINSVAAFAMTLYLFALTRVWDLAELWELGWDLTAIQSWDDGLAVVSSPSCNRMFRIYRLELIFVFPRDSISIK